MSHFAVIDENNIVTQVLVIEQDVIDPGLSYVRDEETVSWKLSQ